MLRLLADENFNGKIVRGLLERDQTLSILRVQDSTLSGADDEELLAWAAREDRILRTHDVATIPNFAWQRVKSGKPMPGVFVAKTSLPIRQVIDELLLAAQCGTEQDWADQVEFLPL